MEKMDFKKTYFLTLSCILIGFLPLISWGYNNGLARTPPMGWLTWERFRCNTDCLEDPYNCIGERLIKRMADSIVDEGYKELGYEYVIIDDCWMSEKRDKEGKLVGDPVRFPSGIKALADYVHSKGLKFGIYEDVGIKTCAGYPGSYGHFKTDADTFAQWGVDYVKFDGCNSIPLLMDKFYTEFGHYLNLTGRPMVYSCEWPLYQAENRIKPNYTAITAVCNLWRNGPDVQDSWVSIQGLIDLYAENQDEFASLASPGQFNDPDMLVIGNFGLSYEQSVSQMVLWAIWASPLIMSTDLWTIKPEYKGLLQNREIIAINQDPLAKQGRRIYKNGGIELYTRPITPVSGTEFSYAIAFLNRDYGGTPSKVIVTGRMLGLMYPAGYKVKDVTTGKDYGVVYPDDLITINVNPTGAVLLRCRLGSV